MEEQPRIINSLLDNDFYKFTMQNAVTKLFPTARVRYRFVNRGGHKFPEGFAQALRRQVDMMATLQLSADEKRYFARKCRYLDPVYLDFLSGYRYDPSEVHIEQQGGDLEVIIEGYWYRTILWEVSLMSVISELYYIMDRPSPGGRRAGARNHPPEDGSLQRDGHQDSGIRYAPPA